MRTIIHSGMVITANARGDIFPKAILQIEDGRISSISLNGENTKASADETVDARNFVIIPGFIQTHIHLCQSLFKGLADDIPLLGWLQQKIFPMEAAHNEQSMYYSAKLGIAELIRSGTTAILDMGSIHNEEEIIRVIGETGLRAFVGKAMMDINDIFPKYKETTRDSLRSTRELAERWHNSYDGRIKYAVSPRFVLSCSDMLLRDAYEIINDFDGVLFHTHASENRNEIRSVRARCKMENIEFFRHLGVLSERTCLAHCVHLNEEEISILKSTKTNVAHCPSANLKLGSGVAEIPKMLEKEINVSLGADGAPCNNTLNMFEEMRMASLLQKPIHGPAIMPAKTVFEMATIKGAKTLGMEREIGSIEIGKKADIVLLNLGHIHNPVQSQDNLYSSIVYSSRPENVDSVMVDGKWLYRNGKFVCIDEEKAIFEGRKELKLLLNRL